MKYFDEGKEGIKVVMEEVAYSEQEITRELLKDAAYRFPQVQGDLEQWKHLYRALEKLTEGEAAKIVSTVKDENGFEAWRQLHVRFEPELEAQKNKVLTDLHDIDAANNIEETKLKVVELKVRIARAEDILGVAIQEIQKKTALLRIIDPITRQHTARLRGGFNEFYIEVMAFANNAGAGATKDVDKAHAVKEKNEDFEETYDYDYESLNAVGGGGKGKGCFNCGSPDHWKSECPYPPKGTGK